MNLDDIQNILENMVARIGNLIKDGRRQEILNERFLHHMFSWDVGRFLHDRQPQVDRDIWHDLLIAPEAKTNTRFRRNGINLEDAIATRANAVNTGRSGNLDFVLKTSPLICVEWKGPKLYTTANAFEVFLKLLNEPKDSVKIFAAIITSCTSGGRGHLKAAKDYLGLAIKKAREHKETSSLISENVYGYIATFAGSDLHRIHWGQID